LTVEKKAEKAAEAAPKKSVAARVTLVGNQGTFRRSVRDESGGILHTMEFPKGAVVEVDAEELKAIIDDFRTAPNQGALVEVDEKGKTLEKPSAAVEAARKAKAEAEKKRLAEKKAKADGEPLNHDGTPKPKAK
jgi:hypothetical protein